jgi:hypothetical protein
MIMKLNKLNRLDKLLDTIPMRMWKQFDSFNISRVLAGTVGSTRAAETIQLNF